MKIPLLPNQRFYIVVVNESMVTAVSPGSKGYWLWSFKRPAVMRIPGFAGGWAGYACEDKEHAESLVEMFIEFGVHPKAVWIREVKP